MPRGQGSCVYVRAGALIYGLCVVFRHPIINDHGVPISHFHFFHILLGPDCDAPFGLSLTLIIKCSLYGSRPSRPDCVQFSNLNRMCKWIDEWIFFRIFSLFGRPFPSDLMETHGRKSLPTLFAYGESATIVPSENQLLVLFNYVHDNSTEHKSSFLAFVGTMDSAGEFSALEGTINSAAHSIINFL